MEYDATIIRSDLTGGDTLTAPKHYWRIVFLTFSILIGVLFTSPIFAQQTPASYSLNPRFTKIGYQFLFDNGWADQFSGKIYPLNESAFVIEWFKYDDATRIKNETFHYEGADHYEVAVYVYTFTNNTKFKGVFEVTWLVSNYVVSIDASEAFLVIRDKDRVLRPYNEIIRARKYEYVMGNLQ